MMHHRLFALGTNLVLLTMICLIATWLTGCEKAGPVESREGTATVTVSVRDQAGQLLPGATVELYADGVIQSANMLSSKPTGANGQAFFDAVPAKIGQSRLWAIRVISSATGVQCSKDTIVGCRCQQLGVSVQLTCPPTPSICSRNVDNLDFGKVLVGASRDTTYQITNTGTAPLVINSLAIAGQQPSSSPPPDTVFRVTSPASLPVTLNPGQSSTVRVKFAPQDGRVYTARLVTSSNAAGANSCGDVTLRGEGLAASCSRNVDILDFGKVLIGTSRDTSFQITNSGAAPLVINSLAVANQQPPSSPPPDAVFLVTSPASFPVTVNPGQSATVRVKFAPQDALVYTGVYTARLVISSNATGANSCGDINLRGEGTTTSIIKCASVIRWDQTGYFGWAFSDLPTVTGAVVADSVLIRTNIAHDPLPSPPNGTQLADFVYLGLVNAADPSQGGYILAANGVQLLSGNLNPAYSTFDNTHSHIPAAGYGREIAILVKDNDVVGIRTRSGRYAKIRVDKLFPVGGAVKEELQFCQIFPAIAP